MSNVRACVFACVVAALLSSSLAIADPSQVKCGPSNVVVESASWSDLRHACRGAESAARFLSSNGFSVPSIRITVVAEMPENIPDSALGAYSRSRNEVFILGFSAFAERCRSGCLFNIPADESVYRAVIAHEVAHAIALPNFSVPPTVLSHEYIAFAAFFNALDKRQRDEIFWQYDYDEDWLKYAAILYLKDPLAYGAHAYRHFQQPENGEQFLRRILEGKALGVDE